MAKVVKGRWVTINGTHVFIGGNGKIAKGPRHMLGLPIKEATAIDTKAKKLDKQIRESDRIWGAESVERKDKQGYTILADDHWGQEALKADRLRYYSQGKLSLHKGRNNGFSKHPNHRKNSRKSNTGVSNFDNATSITKKTTKPKKNK